MQEEKGKERRKEGGVSINMAAWLMLIRCLVESSLRCSSSSWSNPTVHMQAKLPLTWILLL